MSDLRRNFSATLSVVSWCSPMRTSPKPPLPSMSPTLNPPTDDGIFSASERPFFGWSEEALPSLMFGGAMNSSTMDKNKMSLSSIIMQSSTSMPEHH